MKKILIVDVPEGGKLHKLMYSVKQGKKPYQYSVSHYAEYTEFTPPSDEQIIGISRQQYTNSISQKAFSWGANWFKSLLQ